MFLNLVCCRWDKTILNLLKACNFLSLGLIFRMSISRKKALSSAVFFLLFPTFRAFMVAMMAADEAVAVDLIFSGMSRTPRHYRHFWMFNTECSLLRKHNIGSHCCIMLKVLIKLLILNFNTNYTCPDHIMLHFSVLSYLIQMPKLPVIKNVFW